MCQSENGDSYFQNVLHADNVKGILQAVEQVGKVCDEVGTVRAVKYLGDRVSGGCEAAVTARR